MLGSSFYALGHALPPGVDAWLLVPSFAFSEQSFCVRTVSALVPTWFRNRYQVFSQFLTSLVGWRCFRNLLSILTAFCCSVLYGLSYWIVRWLVDCCWLSVDVLAVVHWFSCVALLCIHCCVSLLIYASHWLSKLALHTLRLSDVLKKIFLFRLLSCFDTAASWPLFPLEGDQCGVRRPFLMGRSES